MLVIFRLVTMMTYFPLTDESIPATMLGIALSTVVQCVLVIPVILLANSGRNVLSEMHSGTKIAGGIIAACYFLYIAFVGGSSVSHFVIFVKDAFLEKVSIAVGIAAALAVAVYGAYCGIRGIMRSSVIAVFVFAVIMIVLAVSSVGETAPSEVLVYRGITLKSVISATLTDLSRGGELVILSLLLFCTGKPRSAGYGYIATRLVVTEGIVFLLAAVLGGYVNIAKYPFYAIGTFGNALHLEGVFFVMWCVFAEIRLALIVFLLGDILSGFFPKLPARLILSGVAVAACALPFIFGGVSPSALQALSVVLLSAVVPFVAAIMSEKRKEA